MNMGKRTRKPMQLTPHELSRAKGGFVGGDFRVQADLNKVVYAGIVNPSNAGATIFFPLRSKGRSRQ